MADKIVTQDPTQPGVNKVNGPIVTNGLIDFAGLSIAGAVANDVLTFTGGVWAPVAPSGVESASNLGAGNGVFAGKVGTDFQFKSLIAGTGITLTPTATDITIATSGSGGITESFTSAPQTITTGGALTLAHGLTGSPKFVISVIKCVTAQGNYSINDELFVPLMHSDASNSCGVAVVPDATNLNCRYGGTGTVFQVLNKTTGANIALTNANWSLILKAFL